MKLDGKLYRGIHVWARRGRGPHAFVVFCCDDRALRYPGLCPPPEEVQTVVIGYEPGAQVRGVEIPPSATVHPQATRLPLASLQAAFRPASAGSIPWAVRNVLGEALGKIQAAASLAHRASC